MLRLSAAILTLLGVLAVSSPASAHCDTVQGPVVTAARAALAAEDASLVLHWVRPEDESAIRAAFQQTIEARRLGPAAMALADQYFFETLVRLHRAGEGAPYTGLNDVEPEPIIAATDDALQRGSADELEQQLMTAIKAGLAERFAAARATKDFRPGDVAAGRLFVADYVSLTHWVEGVFTAAQGTSEHHAASPAHAAAAHPAIHEPGSHAESVPAAREHGANELEHLPWILTTAFALLALAEGAFLLRQRRHAAA
jgi:hypothetical protein